MAQRFESLDGLRGLLALLVMLGHLGLNSALARLGVRLHYELAVDFFFVLSGFVLSATAFFGGKQMLPFLIGRAFRLWPLHALTATWVLAIAPSGTGSDYWLNLMLLNNVGLPPNEFTLNFPAWSVSVEMWVSIAAFAAASRLRPDHALALGGCAVAAIAASPALQQGGAHNLDIGFNSGLLRGLCGFAAGMMAHRLFELMRRRGLAAPNALAPLVLMLALACLLQWRDFPGRFAPSFYLLTPLAVALYALREGRLLASRWLRELGRLSYAIYLLHVPLLYSFERLLGQDGARGLAVKLLLIASVLISAKLVHHAIELPLMKLGGRVGWRLKKANHSIAGA